MKELIFPCDGCGLCCEHLGEILAKNMDPKSIFYEISREFPYKADETGTCEKLDKVTRRCTVYQNRPELCQVSKMYDRYPYLASSKQMWFNLNKEVCNKFKRDGKKRKCG